MKVSLRARCACKQAKVAHPKPCKPWQGRGGGQLQGQMTCSLVARQLGAERQNKHCIVFPTAKGLEDGDGFEVPSPSQGTDVLKPLGQAVTMHELRYKLVGITGASGVGGVMWIKHQERKNSSKDQSRKI